ncbi:MAG: hypothetical protein HYZ44_07470 [Bacteroidetes bacterium]|nr:hypothetical protein [Bacteroidota bacterium]
MVFCGNVENARVKRISCKKIYRNERQQSFERAVRLLLFKHYLQIREVVGRLYKVNQQLPVFFLHEISFINFRCLDDELVVCYRSVA